eukprot:g20886.t1
MLQRVLQQGRCSLRRLLSVADEVPALEDFQGVMPGADYSACLKEVEPERAAGQPHSDEIPVEIQQEALPDRLSQVTGMSRSVLLLWQRVGRQIRQPSRADWAGPCERLLEVQKKPSGDKTGACVEALERQRPPDALSESSEDGAGRPAEEVPDCCEIELQLSPLHPLGSLVGKLELFWIHKPGETPSADSAVGLVCFQFVQGRMFESGRVLVSSTVLCSGYASHYARILHLSVASPEALRSAVLNSKRLIFGTLPVQSVRVTVLAAEDGERRICVDPQVEQAFHQCGFRWFQLTQKLRRQKSAFLPVRFLVLHSPRSDLDPPPPRDNIGMKSPLLLQNQPDALRDHSASPEVETAPEEELTFSAW